MKARKLLIIALFVVGTSAAVMVVAGAVDPSPLSPIDDTEMGCPEPVTAEACITFAHVRGFLASTPDAKNLVTSPQGRALLPQCRGIMLRHFRRDQVVPGTIEVLRNGATVGLFQASVEIVPIDAQRFVIHRAWHDTEVEIVCVTIPRLAALPEESVIERAEAITNGDQLFDFDEAAFAEVRVPRDLPPGEHPLTYAQGARSIGEILILYPSTREDADHGIHLMRLEPHANRVTIVAPEDGAFRAFDEAQAPFRVLRDPTTGRVVGDGPRVRPFLLSHDLTRVEKWLE